MELNTEITHYSRHAEEQSAFKAMQEASFEIAELLIKHPNKIAPDIQGSAYLVAEMDGDLHIFSSPDTIIGNVTPKNCSVFIVSGYEGQSAAELQETTKNMNDWIKNPVYKEAEKEVLQNLVDYHFSRVTPVFK